ncbi:MAG: flavin reductase [Lentisphaerae bacterium RIFOXYB12_FULL_60_10]|nr:MAG: flavin reductase [Lentisphaerae bacterium RIFOXYB12_FULL_60_10]
MLAPLPVSMVTCQAPGGKPNIITVAWAGTVCSEPPMLGIAVRPSRYSFNLIRQGKAFVVNVPTIELTAATDSCGVWSGRNVDKFKRLGLTPLPSKTVDVPGIAECPVSLECRLRHEIPLGSHTLFLGEVMGVQVTASLLDKDGRLALEKAGLIAFAHGGYYALGKYLGYFGYSVRKNKRSRAVPRTSTRHA